MPAKKTSTTPLGQTTLFTAVNKKPGKKTTSPKVEKKLPQPIVRPAGKKIWLSATSLEAMRRCPRCFWLQINLKIYQPEGIVSRLANRFDGVIKKYFDLYRGTNSLPPFVTGQLDGQLENPFQETYFVTINDKFGYLGKLDECLVSPDGKFIPVDFKTASSDPTTRELIPAYQWQLDSYAFLLGRNGKSPGPVGHLIYFYPGESPDLHHGFPMEITVKTLTTNPGRLPAMIDQAIELLEHKLPTAATDCKFCRYVETVKDF